MGGTSFDVSVVRNGRVNVVMQGEVDRMPVRIQMVDIRDIGAGGVPVLYTLNGKVLVDLTPRDRVWAVSVSGKDSIRLGLTEDTDLAEPIADFDIRYRGWRSANGVNWQRILGRGVGLLGLTHSMAHVDSQVKDLLRNGVPPDGIPVDDVIDAGPVVFREGSREAETTLKYDLTT